MSITNIKNFSNFKGIRTKDNSILFVNTKDKYIYTDLTVLGEWERYVTILFNKYVKNGMNVIDVGANIGAHTISLSKLVGETGNVYAFEPSKINHDILIYNCFINNCYNTVVYKKGCGDKKDKMFISNEWSNIGDEIKNYGFIVLESEKKHENDEIIDVIPLDDLDTEIHLIKIDDEYMEDKVLIGLEKTLNKYKPIIIIEIHENDFGKVKNILTSFEYFILRLGKKNDYISFPNNKYNLQEELYSINEYFLKMNK